MSSINTTAAVISFVSTLQKDVVNTCGVEPHVPSFVTLLSTSMFKITGKTSLAFERYADRSVESDGASNKRGDVANTTVQNPRSTSFVQMNLGEQRGA